MGDIIPLRRFVCCSVEHGGNHEMGCWGWRQGWGDEWLKIWWAWRVGISHTWTRHAILQLNCIRLSEVGTNAKKRVAGVGRWRLVCYCRVRSSVYVKVPFEMLALLAVQLNQLYAPMYQLYFILQWQSRAVFLKRRAAGRYRALALIIPGSERFSWNLSFVVF